MKKGYLNLIKLSSLKINFFLQTHKLCLVEFENVEVKVMKGKTCEQ